MKKDAHIDVLVASFGMNYMDATNQNRCYVQTSQQNGNMTPEHALRILSTQRIGKTPEELDEAMCVLAELVASQSHPDEPTTEGLEEAADAHIRSVADAGWDWTTQDIAEAFIAGAEWMAGHDKVLTIGTVDELCYDCHDRVPELIEKIGLSADDRVELIIRKI